MSEAANAVAVVTGASRGIGFEIAKCFAKDGHGLVIVGDHEPRLEEARQALLSAGAPEVDVIVADLARPEGPQTVFEAVEALGVKPEFLVNNAGVVVHGDFARETNWRSEREMIELNVVSVAHLTKLFARGMVERGSGKILITSSIAGLAPTPWTSVYAATKAFDYAFAEALAGELQGAGVTVTVLVPGATDTNIFRRADMENTKFVVGSKADPAVIGRAGYDAMMKGAAKVVAPFTTKVAAALIGVMPRPVVKWLARAMSLDAPTPPRS